MIKLLVCMGLFISNAVFAQADIEPLYGEWRGTGDQNNGSHWSIRLNVQADFVMIDYPSLICGGVLKPLKTQKNNFFFKEILTYGITRCLNQGQVVIDKTAQNQARYYWFGNNGHLQATGNLNRVGVKP